MYSISNVSVIDTITKGCHLFFAHSSRRPSCSSCRRVRDYKHMGVGQKTNCHCTQILTAQMMMDDFFIYSKYLVPVEIESKENLR